MIRKELCLFSVWVTWRMMWRWCFFYLGRFAVKRKLMKVSHGQMWRWQAGRWQTWEYETERCDDDIMIKLWHCKGDKMADHKYKNMRINSQQDINQIYVKTKSSNYNKTKQIFVFRTVRQLIINFFGVIFDYENSIVSVIVCNFWSFHKSCLSETKLYQLPLSLRIEHK